MPTTGNIPLADAIDGQTITSTLWNNEFQNIGTLLDAQGAGGYSATDSQMQVQTNPYPGSVTSRASSIAGELERIRYALAQITGKTYWYQGPDASLANVSNSLVPVGGIIDYPSATAPNVNWHVPDGTAVSRTLYSELFSLVGTTFGVGDGSTTFNLPNFTDKLSIAAGNLYALGATGGSTTHTLTNAELPHNTYTVTDPGHTHTITDPGHSHGVTDPTHTHVEKGDTVGGTAQTGVNATGHNNTANAFNSTAAASTGVTVNSATTGITGSNSNTTGISVSDGNGGGSHSIMNPYLGMYKMMRIK